MARTKTTKKIHKGGLKKPKIASPRAKMVKVGALHPVQPIISTSSKKKNPGLDSNGNIDITQKQAENYINHKSHGGGPVRPVYTHMGGAKCKTGYTPFINTTTGALTCRSNNSKSGNTKMTSEQRKAAHKTRHENYFRKAVTLSKNIVSENSGLQPGKMVAKAISEARKTFGAKPKRAINPESLKTIKKKFKKSLELYEDASGHVSQQNKAAALAIAIKKGYGARSKAQE